MPDGPDPVAADRGVLRERRLTLVAWVAAGLGLFMLGGAAVALSVLSYQDHDEDARTIAANQDTISDLQAALVDLNAELRCRSRESSPATQHEGDIAREGWLAMTIWARTGDSEHPRIVEAADRVAVLYDELAPELIARREATATCAR